MYFPLFLAQHAEIIVEFGKFISCVDERHLEIRSLVQERLNQMKMNSEDHANEDMDESGDDVRSTVTSLSDAISDTSSKISLSRLSEMKDNLVQKATNAMFSKVIKTGTILIENLTFSIMMMIIV